MENFYNTLNEKIQSYLTGISSVDLIVILLIVVLVLIIGRRLLIIISLFALTYLLLRFYGIEISEKLLLLLFLATIGFYLIIKRRKITKKP